MSNLISPTLLMRKPNEKKVIFNGFCNLIHKENTIKTKVKIFYEWIPDIKIKIHIKNIPFIMAHSFADSGVIKGPNFEITKFFISSIRGFINADVTGYLDGNFKIGDIKEKQKIFKIDFTLLNLKSYFGKNFFYENSKGKHWSRGELKFFSNSTELNIHQYFKEETQQDLLNKYGGFLSTHGGCIIFKEGINQFEYSYFIKRIGLFFSFINGRRSYPNFLKIYDINGKLILRDYTTYFVDKNKYVSSWIPQIIDADFQDLWPNFLELTESEDDFERMDLIIHWYLEALNNSGFINGSIILIQNSYELLFNWIFNEEKIIISSDSLEKIRASDKLRLLLDKFDLEFNLPEKYLEKYKDEIKKDPTLKDFPYQFTEFRNHFVHFKMSKKSKLNNRPEGFSWSLLNTSIFNLEQIILKILRYKGKIRSRVHKNLWRGTNEIDLK
ncbi:hypothetical protein [Aquiflexum gelatinilyticum]|uniref:YopA central domain-containing protein n=1 Tax=Aquiflexum gelatinilyticum TaxID=2961943 RepID=A0A9X2P887_9BACT|nr:hypothetical protein [Aquiflexum gelatinilyticum]MCR9015555.1 hypothetical protein [Aquiflexum gelatinilyticum]